MVNTLSPFKPKPPTECELRHFVAMGVCGGQDFSPTTGSWSISDVITHGVIHAPELEHFLAWSLLRLGVSDVTLTSFPRLPQMSVNYVIETTNHSDAGDRESSVS